MPSSDPIETPTPPPGADVAATRADVDRGLGAERVRHHSARQPDGGTRTDAHRARASRGSSRPRARPRPDVVRLRRRGEKPRPTVHDRMTLIEHLAELRRRSSSACSPSPSAVSIALIFYPQILDWLTGPYRDVCEAKNLTVPGQARDHRSARGLRDPHEDRRLRRRSCSRCRWSSGSSGGSSRPGCTRTRSATRSRSSSRRSLCSSWAPLIALWTFPKALQFLIAFGGGRQPLFAPGEYFSLIMLMMLAFGVGFEFPILLVFLAAGRRAHRRSSSRPLGASRSSGSSSSSPSSRRAATRSACSRCRSRCSSSTRSSIVIGKLVLRHRTRSAPAPAT